MLFFSGNGISLKFPKHPYIHHDKLLFVAMKSTRCYHGLNFFYQKIVPLTFNQTFVGNFCYNINICILLNHL